MSDNGNEPTETNQDEWFLPEDSREHLGKLFKEMPNEVTLEVFTKEHVNPSYNEAMLMFMRDIERLAEKITVHYNDLDSDKAKELDVTRSPSLLIQPDTYSIRYTGAPIGEEARIFIETVLLISHGKSGLSPVSQNLLAELNEKRHCMVFVSPSCPYCPGQVANAFRAAIERPEFVSAECVETSENRDLADKYQAYSVPMTVVNETFIQKGLLPEERFVVEMAAMKDAEQLLEEAGQDAPLPPGIERPQEVEGGAEAVDVVVAGGGPAGLTAAIYLERSGLKTVVLEKAIVGGQVTQTPEVENYTGFRKVGGLQLVEMMAEQAREYCNVIEGEEVDEIKIGRDIEVFSNRKKYICKAVILATGAHSKRLGVPGEDELFGRGVSVCASCDGWAYKEKDVIMVGGGSTALTEALHLKNMGVNVTIVHRRDEFRAEKHLQASVEREGIPILWNTQVERFTGDDKGLASVTLRNTKDDTVSELAVHGAFVAIGWNPNTEIAEQLGVTLDEWGYIVVDRNMRTNIPRVYACGDVVGGVQQIVTAVGEGSTAALAVFEDISNPYWKR